MLCWQPDACVWAALFKLAWRRAARPALQAPGSPLDSTAVYDFLQRFMLPGGAARGCCSGAGAAGSRLPGVLAWAVRCRMPPALKPFALHSIPCRCRRPPGLPDAGAAAQALPAHQAHERAGAVGAAAGSRQQAQRSQAATALVRDFGRSRGGKGEGQVGWFCRYTKHHHVQMNCTSPSKTPRFCFNCLAEVAQHARRSRLLDL